MQRHFTAPLPDAVSGSSIRRPSNTIGIEMPERTSVSTCHTRFNAQLSRRRQNNQAVIVNPLSHLTDEELVADVYQFQANFLGSVKPEDLLRAARVAKDVRTYDGVARSEDPAAGSGLPVTLKPEEKEALKAEKDVLFSERGMFVVILTVSLAAFLQGFVQSSINGASLYSDRFAPGSQNVTGNSKPPAAVWKLGAANASPFLFAAVLGCFASLPINDLVGRRGAMAVAAILIFSSSLGSAWCRSWGSLFGVRAINGIGMGIKAVSTPILASETAVGFWRGSSILAWQLWPVVLPRKSKVLHAAEKLALQPHEGVRDAETDPHDRYSKATNNDATVKLQALRDIYLIYKSVQLEEYSHETDAESQRGPTRRGVLSYFRGYLAEYRDLVVVRRLRNALISSSTVNLAQQLCGINVLAFYSGTLFTRVNGPSDASPIRTAMFYSLGYGAVNFLFGLPAIRTIDTLGRRKWLILTLPLMCLAMLGAALSAALITDQHAKIGIMAFFLYCPIPFTLASESFPLSHREAGCASAIAVNLLFAGFLTLFFPSIVFRLQDGGVLGLFSGLNLLAFALVFLLVEETKRRSLEDLDLVFAVRKSRFMKHQLTQYLPWWFHYYIRRNKTAEQPSLYLDLIWGPKEVSLDEQRPDIFDHPLENGNDGEPPVEGGRISTDTDHN
ncbi:sugar transporter [Apiospora sp. TS-2023a]